MFVVPSFFIIVIYWFHTRILCAHMLKCESTHTLYFFGYPWSNKLPPVCWGFAFWTAAVSYFLRLITAQLGILIPHPDFKRQSLQDRHFHFLVPLTEYYLLLILQTICKPLKLQLISDHSLHYLFSFCSDSPRWIFTNKFIHSNHPWYHCTINYISQY